jgi:hypothetical protein
MKTVGAVTKNKAISWKVNYSNGENKEYSHLADLCDTEQINRSNVYKIVIGKSRPIRKKHIRSIEKIYNDNIEDYD